MAIKGNGKELRFESADEIDAWIEAKTELNGMSRQEFARQELYALAAEWLASLKVDVAHATRYGLMPERAGNSRKVSDKSDNGPT